MSNPITRKQAHVAGTDIHYVETGDGQPLLLLHAGFLSTDDIWEGHPAGYVSHLGSLASRFRVIAPDARGHGRTLHPPGDSISYEQLADDVAALSTVLGLQRPMVCGFSDGATIATVAAIRHPDAFRAVVNHAGFDVLHPGSRVFAMSRQIFGGSPDATKPVPAAFAGFAAAQGGPMADFMRRTQLDHRAQGGWERTLAMAFDRLTTPALDLESLRKITAPTLILGGDRDMFCPAEEAASAYRMLSTGELGIVPGTGHEVSRIAIELTTGFLQRHAQGR